jgi:hypothetical protein
MFHVLSGSRPVWLGIGLVGGLILCGLWPQAPLHAVATDRVDTFAMATGYVDEGVEAVYFLDFLTGDLSAVALSRQGRGFTAIYGYPGAKLMADLGVDPAKKPQYMMVTGAAYTRRGAGGTQLSPSVVYVAEVTTGMVAAYGIPWSRAAYTSGRPVSGQLLPLAKSRFRASADPGLGTVPGL